MVRVVDTFEEATCEMGFQEAVVLETIRPGVEVRCVAQMTGPQLPECGGLGGPASPDHFRGTNRKSAANAWAGVRCAASDCVW
jgi:hypothetical protein